MLFVPVKHPARKHHSRNRQSNPRVMRRPVRPVELNRNRLPAVLLGVKNVSDDGENVLKPVGKNKVTG